MTASILALAVSRKPNAIKTPRLITLLAAALLCAASPHSLPAAEEVVAISFFAPRDPNAVVRQIELNVAIKQYEEVLMEAHEARLQNETGTPETGLMDNQRKGWHVRAERKVKYLKITAADFGRAEQGLRVRR